MDKQTFCLVCGCSSHEVEKMHNFPSKLERSKAWQESMGMKFAGLSLTNYKICCRHFSPECYVTNTRYRLRPDCVPTLLPCAPPLLTYLIKSEMEIEESSVANSPDRLEMSAIETLQTEIENLEITLANKKEQLQKLLDLEPSNKTNYNGLSTKEVVRYSRQMLLNDISVEGQNKLKKSKVLIVGAGGLGCPSSLYLASAGIGEITIADYDDVELTNLHRQILHSEHEIGLPKVNSASEKLQKINRDIKITPLKTHINTESIKKLLESTKFDVVLDCTDNVATRYLLNDACVIYKIPLVSGSALQFEGQLTVYNFKNGPCYRCVFPKPPPPNTVTNCGDGGVLGPIPGVIGVLQALEAIKIIVGCDGVLSERMLLFDGSETIFRNIKLRHKNPNCAVCGENREIYNLIDYEQFCGSSAHDKVTDINILSSVENVDSKEFMSLKDDCLVVDVRPKLEFKMCHLDNSINYPYSLIENEEIIDLVDALNRKICENWTNRERRHKVLVLCRRGNDSQRAVVKLKEIFPSLPVDFVNVSGGLHAYAKNCNSSFPIY